MLVIGQATDYTQHGRDHCSLVSFQQLPKCLFGA